MRPSKSQANAKNGLILSRKNNGSGLLSARDRSDLSQSHTQDQSSMALLQQQLL